MKQQLNNWAGNYTYSAAQLLHPRTVEEVRRIVWQSSKIKALGTRHSFSSIADTTETLISLDRFEPIFELDRQHSRVTLNANARYGQICERLDREGFALHNLASLPHISVVGACATATHGSGVKNGNLATAVNAVEIVTGEGEVIAVSREQHGEEFAGMVVSLGGLGVITKLTLELMPTFQMRQNVYENLPFEQLAHHFDDIMSSAYSVSLFTNWRDDIDQVWVKSQVGDEDDFTEKADFYGATPAPAQRHPIPGISGEPCTEQLGVPGPWYERLPHFRMEFTPSSGEELQSEYFVSYEHAVAAIQAIHELRDRISPLLQISEIRTIAADDLWMSPCCRQACIGIHFTWKKDWQGVSAVLPRIEERLTAFGARPHWGKLFTMQPTQVQAFYPRLSDFKRLMSKYDPEGKFRNDYLDSYLGLPVVGSR